MQVTPNFLRKIAALAVIVPLVFTLVAQAIIWTIPGCNPNPYAPGQCAGSVTLANALIFGQLGGVYVALLLGLFVSIPLLITAIVLQFLRRRYAKNA